MKKIFLLLLIGVVVPCSLDAAFERLRNFLGGDRYYYDYYYPYDYYDSNSYYYGPRIRYSSYPRYRRSRYYYGPVRPADNKTAINEDANKYTITVLLPGYTKSDIHIEALERSMRLVANPSAQPIQTETQGSVPQVPSIQQIIPLGALINPAAVTSEYVNGVLTITVPKLTNTIGSAITVPVQ